MLEILTAGFGMRCISPWSIHNNNPYTSGTARYWFTEVLFTVHARIQQRDVFYNYQAMY